MSMTALAYADKAQEICVLPDIYLKLQEMLADDKTALNDIAEVIVLDPALSLKLLKIANSALFNFQKEIDSIPRALMILGLEEVKNLINVYGTTEAFSAIDNSVIDMDRFWEISVDCALITKYLAKKKHIANADGLFLSALLHNIGELVVAQVSPEKAKYCANYSGDETPWQRQQDVLGFNYSDCSVELLRLWNLPESLIAPIKQFQCAYGEDVSEASALLYISTRVALLNSHPGMYNKKRFVGQHIMQDLSISFSDVDEAINYCNAQGMELLSVLSLKSK